MGCMFSKKPYSWKDYADGTSGTFMKPFDLDEENINPNDVEGVVTESEYSQEQKDYLVQQSAIAAFHGVLEAWLLLKPACKVASQIAACCGPQAKEMVKTLGSVVNFFFCIIGSTCGAIGYFCTFCVGGCKCSCCWDGSCYQFRQLERFYVLPVSISRALLAMEETAKVFCEDGSATLLNDPVQKLLDPKVALFNDRHLASTYRFAIYLGGNYVTKRVKRCSSLLCNPVACIMEVTLLEQDRGKTHVEIQCSWARPFGCFRWFCSQSFFPVKDAMRIFGETLLMKVLKVQGSGSEEVQKFNREWNSMTHAEKEEVEAHQRSLRGDMVRQSTVEVLKKSVTRSGTESFRKDVMDASEDSPAPKIMGAGVDQEQSPGNL